MMNSKKMCSLLPPTSLLLLSFLALSSLSYSDEGSLRPHFYDGSCPRAEEIVRSVIAKAVAKDPRMAASLIRLHFHDCFVKGCDGSILLDSSGHITSEKRSNPNRDSAKGFEVIEEIKSALEEACPQTVSCADILALAARDSTVAAGGPYWEVPLGRRDSLTASVQGSNNNIPAPTSTLQILITKFKRQGLGVVDLVALSGSHTIGDSRCTSFRRRLYNQTGAGLPDPTLDPDYASQLRLRCPPSGGDQTLFALDPATQFEFDNQYFKNLMANRGLLNSDEVLFSGGGATAELVRRFADSNEAFFDQFAKSIVKMGSISPLTGSEGEIRSRCRTINH